MQRFGEPGTTPAPSTNTTRPFRRLSRGRLLLTSLVLIALAASIPITRLEVGRSWRTIAPVGWLSSLAWHAPTASSPQGCARGSVAPQPPSTAISSARGALGTQGEVALTFDDGPFPRYSPQILDALRAAGAHATFFVEGVHARRYPDLVRAELAGGHAVGNHTDTHPSLPDASTREVREQLRRTTASIKSISGDPCLWLFRPPYGHWNARVLAEVRRQGFTMVLWDVDAADWRGPSSAVIAQRIIAHLHPGAIVLLHDWVRNTAQALPSILRAMRARGLRAVTLPQLLRDGGLVGVSAPSSGAHGLPTPCIPCRMPTCGQGPPGHRNCQSHRVVGKRAET